MRPAPDRTARGIEGRIMSTVIAKKQIPFVDIGAVMDVDVLIIDQEIPSLLPLIDM